MYSELLVIMFRLKRWLGELFNKDIQPATQVSTSITKRDLEILTDRAITLYERVVPLRERVGKPLVRALVLEYLTDKYGEGVGDQDGPRHSAI